MHALGAFVWVVYWRPVPAVLPGGPAAGVWDTTCGRVMAAADGVVLYSLDNPELPGTHGGDPDADAGHGTPYRFVRADRVFADREAADVAAKSLPPPK